MCSRILALPCRPYDAQQPQTEASRLLSSHQFAMLRLLPCCCCCSCSCSCCCCCCCALQDTLPPVPELASCHAPATLSAPPVTRVALLGPLSFPPRNYRQCDWPTSCILAFKAWWF
ncbi:hypothetical protein BCV70DRAFT_97824 [Testicularia cyperi]|uniref:Uncharacterized protein n=1 Tax=Testicularia cyperi TaxID=1882483 RepID=A0A317XS30_9BASI|nr:hypothetical protein BCV70DRAFT_97824 [Testicularia cyperi]